jgi:hypothetical protein
MAKRTIYLNYDINGQPSDAYEVKLASDDGTYGIKEFDTNTVTIPNGENTSNPQTGLYEYEVDLNNDTIYQVSWKVTATPHDKPDYKIQLIGPFTIDAQNIRAVADYKGSFIQGTTATMMLKITDFDGNAVDADTITVIIRDINDILVDSFTPEHVITGYYVFDWAIPLTQANGEYEVVWTYVIDGNTRVELQQIVIATDATDTEIFSGSAIEFRFALESYLRCSQSIPVYFEQSKETIDNRIYRFTFPRWNQTTGVKIYRNKKLVTTSDLEVNFFKGEVVFDDPLNDYDVINADYNFRWHSDSDLYTFLTNAINVFNSFPPHSYYTIYTLPSRYIPGVLYKAATDALRQLMLCLQFQEPQQVFGGPEGASKAFANLETLKKNYEDEWKMIMENKKYGPYVGLTMSVVTPEYSLPGGRSLSSKTPIIRYISSENVYTNNKDCIYKYDECIKDNNKIVYTTIEEAYNLFHQGKSIIVLAQDDKTGELVFTKVDQVFESGEKEICVMTTEKGLKIESSKEHLFYVNGKYIPLEDSEIGDEIVIYKNGKVEEDKILDITYTGKTVKMYDMDVPSTQNFFASGIKCHNSRWFRYLFSGAGG